MNGGLPSFLARSSPARVMIGTAMAPTTAPSGTRKVSLRWAAGHALTRMRGHGGQRQQHDDEVHEQGVGGKSVDLHVGGT